MGTDKIYALWDPKSLDFSGVTEDLCSEGRHWAKRGGKRITEFSYRRNLLCLSSPLAKIWGLPIQRKSCTLTKNQHLRLCKAFQGALPHLCQRMVRMWRPRDAPELSWSLQQWHQWRAPSCTIPRGKAPRRGLGGQHRPSHNAPRLEMPLQDVYERCYLQHIPCALHLWWVFGGPEAHGKKRCCQPPPSTSEQHPNSLALCCVLQDVYPKDGRFHRAFLPTKHILCVLLAFALQEAPLRRELRTSRTLWCWCKEMQGADQEMETTGYCLAFGLLFSAHGPLGVQRSELKYGATGCHLVSVTCRPGGRE